MKRGFTLVEILVAVTIFVSVVAVASSLFVSAIRDQRRNLAYQELLDQTSYVMEYMSRSIRMARRDDICTGASGLNYTTSTIAALPGAECLCFENYKDECQYFCLDGTKLVTATTTPPAVPAAATDFTDLTSPELKVYPLGGDWINLSGESQYPDTDQPLVTISFEIEGREEASIRIQTSISQRNLDM